MKTLQKQFLQTFKIVVLGLVVGLGANYVFAVSWTPPAGSPPGNNTAAPINVTGSAQTKLGGLVVATSAGIQGSTPGFIVRNGYVGIGTTEPTQKLDVDNGYVRGGTGLCIGNDCRTSWPTGGGGGGGVGPGTPNRVPKFLTNTTIGDSKIYDSGTNVGINNTNPTATLDVEGAVRIRGTGGQNTPAQGRVLVSNDGQGNAVWRGIVVKGCYWKPLEGGDPVTITCDNDGNQIMTGIKTIDEPEEGYRGVQSIRCCDLGLSGMP
jgi:hypothetical protein